RDGPEQRPRVPRHLRAARPAERMHVHAGHDHDDGDQHDVDHPGDDHHHDDHAHDHAGDAAHDHDDHGDQHDVDYPGDDHHHHDDHAHDHAGDVAHDHDDDRRHHDHHARHDDDHHHHRADHDDLDHRAWQMRRQRHRRVRDHGQLAPRLVVHDAACGGQRGVRRLRRRAHPDSRERPLRGTAGRHPATVE